MGKVYVRRGRVQPIVYRHPWLFSGSVERVEGDVAPGDAVDVLDPKGRFLGRGFYSDASQIRVRLFAFEPGVEPDHAFFRDRLARAAAFRRDALGLPAPGRTDAFRLVHSEADGLPGLVVDRYGDVLVVQISHVALERRKDVLLAALAEVFGPLAVLQRDDPHFRALEGLEPVDAYLSPEGGGADEVEVMELGVRYRVDLRAGQKTGLYFDQRTNRALAATLAGGRRVLDLFSYTGAFALAVAREGGSAGVVAVESSPAAVERGRANARANGFAGIEFVREDAYKYLGALRAGGGAFGMIVLDPPAYAPSSRYLDQGLRKYFDLNSLALSVLSPGGILVTCSCSGAVSEDDFEGALSTASVKAGRAVRVFHRGGQASDHPVSPHCPEGRYLKAFFCQVE
ncbi:MAG: class I SAM-dependent rRNA methyltransferase [Planctomycetes bacterium]|nr:class I SAM-dependent rRNA methyltransferase [Planctomycetota bacterium]